MNSLQTLCAAILLQPLAAAGVTVSIPAAADATLYGPPQQTTANGAGDWFFAGVTSDGNVRRGMLRFDLNGMVPAGALITGVELRLVVDRGRLFPAPVSLHRVTSSWNEGVANASGPEGLGSAAQPGDVTWIFRELGGAAWATPGGDMQAAPSATTDVTGVGPVTFSCPALVADVQSWLDSPGQNFGWSVRGVEYLTQTANRFVSRSSPTAGSRPALVVTFTPVPEPGTAVFAVATLLLSLRRWR